MGGVRMGSGIAAGTYIVATVMGFMPYMASQG